MTLLETINSPADLRRLNMEELRELAQELRERIFQSVSINGGHLSSNLGVVELTIALHYVYDFGPYPKGPDWLLFDVGHQCYAHKMLTGRAGLFDHLRKKGSVSGFPSPEESSYDLFAVGHAGTAISTAVGLARAEVLAGKENHVVAVVGDASIVNGLAFEGLNNAGTVARQLLIVLNDNGMSISKPQGAFSQYLERVRVSTTYEEFKRVSERIVNKLPTSVGHVVEAAWSAITGGVKGVMWPGQIFENLGVKYMGPIDGHDLPGLINFLSEIKHVKKPVLLHVKTVKGHGYEVTANEPTKMHSPSPFKVNGGGEVEISKASGKSWTSAFAEALIELARRDSRIVGLTAAMPDGTGMSQFEKAFPERCFDTGICEGHLVAMAAGLCKRGMRPVAALYSTFLQRAFDQVWQEVALNGLPVIFCLDRAGLVGDDGAVHHGFVDQALLRPLPGMVLMAPSDEGELRRALKLALSLETPSAIRYPRDVVPGCGLEELIDSELRDDATREWAVGRSRVLREGSDATIVSYGALTASALAAAGALEEEGVEVSKRGIPRLEPLSVGVADARFCKPVDGAMLERVLRPNHAVVTVEDHALQNGFGSAVLEYAVAHQLPTQWITRLGLPDRLIEHATRKEQLAEVGLDEAGIGRAVHDAVRRAGRPVEVG